MVDLPARFQNELADRYTLERELGQGGMATVYLARDLKHERPVALKVMRPELAAALGPERFLREIRTTARLQHPHILPVLDSGEAAGQLWYTMPFVRGESLRDRLRRDVQLPVDEGVDFMRQVALALDHAHREGVVHRDLKPENILLSEGQALVADFGIAKAVEAGAGGQLTATGMAVGTPQYMSPEQASGAQVDGRSDVYSLGCVLYEMLAGEPPYTGPTAQAIVIKRLSDPVPGVRRLRPAVPLALEQATTRALAPTPADRFPSAAAFAGALMPGPASPAAGEPWAGARRYAYLAAAALVLVALVLGYVGSRRHPAAPIKSMADARAAAGPGSLGATKSLAVLPLVNIGGDTATEYFSDGLTDELTSALGKVPGLRVAARSSAFAFKGRTVDVQEVGAKLHVANVLEGSVRRAGPRLRLTAQLLNAADGLTLWTETYERELKGVFQVQQDVAGAIAGALGTTLGVEARARVAARPPANLEAYDLYLKGRYAFNQETEEGFRTSIGLYQQALAKDSTYAPAWAGLASSWSWLADNFLAPREAYPRGKIAALKAVALDSTLADAHAALGLMLLEFDWDLQGAEHEFREAIALNPSAANAFHFLGYRLLTDPRLLDSALTVMRRGQALDPLSAWTTGDVSWVLDLNRRYAEAAEEARKAIALNPRSGVGYNYLGQALLDDGNAREALSAFLQAQQLGLYSRHDVVRALAAMGRCREALDTLRELERDAGRRYVDGTRIAEAHTALGNHDAAYGWLETAFRQRSANMLNLRAAPFWEPLRSDARFRELVRRVGLLR